MQLGEYNLDMLLNRHLRVAQGIADLLVGIARRQTLQHDPFALGKWLDQAHVLHVRLGPTGAFTHRLAKKPWVEQYAAAGNRGDGADDQVPAGVFKQVAARTGTQRVRDKDVVSKAGHDHDVYLGMLLLHA